MDFDLTDEQKLLVDMAERYAREKYGHEVRRSITRSEDGFSREHWSQFAEMGWLALPLPEDVGGLGGSDIDIALLMEQLGSALVMEPIVDTAILCANLIAQSDNKTLRERILGEVAVGNCILALAHSEGDGRFEYDACVSASASPTPNGWALSGIKHQIIYGASADFWLVSAKLDGSADFGVFAVPRDAAGVRLSSYRLIDGRMAADLILSEVALSTDDIVLQPGPARDILEGALDRAVIATTAGVVGSMDAVLTMTAEYIQTREQYGQPLAKFQALQHRLAEMFVETEQARAILYRALSALESGDAEHRRRAVSAAKALVAKAGHFVASQGIQLHGGIGVTDEFAVGHHYKAVLVYDKRFGDGAFHLARSAGLAP